MRIIAGRFRSRRLKASIPNVTRPTSDRLRETLFNILGPCVIESVFLDAYAGTGGVGIEAISRGASRVFFVDRASKASAAIRASLESLDVTAGYRVLQMELGRALDVLDREGVRFDIVFLDPPYLRSDLYVRDLEQLATRGLVKSGSSIVAEHSRKLTLPPAVGRLRRVQTRQQGDSALSFYRPEVE
jgi:16S rRNA (guanine966-N2)-methyltransferase